MYLQNYFMCKIRTTLNALGKAFFFISYLNGAENSRDLFSKNNLYYMYYMSI